jgi:protein O-GlcNAc transferase
MFKWITNSSPPAIAQANQRVEQLQREGNALLAKGQLQEAEQCYRQAVALDAKNPAGRISLGFILLQQQRHVEAEIELTEANMLDQENADCHYMLGELAEKQLSFETAVEHFQHAFALKPDFELACRDACRVLFILGRTVEARAQINAGLTLNPFNGDFHFYQGNLHLAEKQPHLALESYQKALSFGADHASLHCFIGRILQQRGETEIARWHLARAMELDSTIAEAHHGMGIINYYYGHFDEAIVNQKTAIALDPSLLHAHTCLLFSLSFALDCSPEQYLSQARIFGEAASRAVLPRLPPRDTLPVLPANRPLRIGWVSGDFRFHPVASFFEGILANLAQEPLTLIAFSNNPHNDVVTDRLRGWMTEWHDIWGMSDMDAATLIRSRQIDVLVDLSGHTSYTRLPVFAWRSAPTQVSWMGYFASTGMAEIDYYLADQYSVPDEWMPYFSERIKYLPNIRLCMTVPKGAELPTGSLPAYSNGFVTFGCFQALGKINDAVVETWSAIMAILPTSRMRIQVRNIEYPGVKEQLLSRLERAGIDRGRVSLFGQAPLNDYLAAYSEVDMILDTFPYPGGATTADALWMGVPTVTIKGGSLLARQGASILHVTGLPDWIAESKAEYIEIAVRMATNKIGLAELRSRLREQALKSPLYDNQRFAKNFSRILHELHEEKNTSINSPKTPASHP